MNVTDYSFISIFVMEEDGLAYLSTEIATRVKTLTLTERMEM